MRNRGIELFMLPDPYQLMPSPKSTPSQAPPLPPAALRADSATAAEARSLLACELESVVSADGVPGRQPAACLAAAHLRLVEQAAKLHRYGFSQSLCSNKKYALSVYLCQLDALEWTKLCRRHVQLATPVLLTLVTKIMSDGLVFLAVKGSSSCSPDSKPHPRHLNIARRIGKVTVVGTPCL